jgi:DNA-directed RNA polymerase
MNMHSPPTAEGNFCDKHGIGLKPAIVQDCVRRGVNGEICIKNHYYVRRLPWKGKKKLCFHLLNLIILNSFLSTVIQIISLTVQTDVGEGPNTGGREGSLNLTRQKGELHAPANSEILHKTQQALTFEQKSTEWHVCSANNTNDQN